jgi:hypothetical protein
LKTDYLTQSMLFGFKNYSESQHLGGRQVAHDFESNLGHIARLCLKQNKTKQNKKILWHPIRSYPHVFIGKSL